MRHAARWRVSSALQRLAELSGRLRAQRPAVRHRAAGQQLQSLAVRLRAGGQRVLLDLRRQVDAADRQLRSLGPQETLARGWTLTFGADGRLLRRAADARPGEPLVTRLQDGEVRSRVDGGAPGSLFDGA
jgi:exodeoxyribonuclease VII large subunit